MLHAIIFRVILQQSRDEDRDDCQRADITDKEPEDAEKLCVAADGSAVCEFIVYISLLESPSHEEDGKETSEGHEDVRRKIVEEIEKISASDLHIRERAE